MMFSWQLSASLGCYLLANKIRGRKRIPLILMLEPTFRCNLTCAGCGRIREYHDVANQMLSAEECIKSVEEVGAPVVCIAGGEPLLHPDIIEIVNRLIKRGYFIYFSTNGLLLEKTLTKFKPDPRLSFVLHMDSLATSHDQFAGLNGVWETAVEGMKAAKKAGFQVRTNTTVYRNTSFEELKQLFNILKQIPVDGMTMAPAFSYSAVDDDVFLSKDEAHAVFRKIYELRNEYRFYNTPVYMEFLAGNRQLTCKPWSNPTRNVSGWRMPCYLIADGHCESFRELIDKTAWERYGPGNDIRCASCMMHCGFEASALDKIGESLPTLARTIKWNLFS